MLLEVVAKALEQALKASAAGGRGRRAMVLVMVTVMTLSFGAELTAVRRGARRRSALTSVGGWGRRALRSVVLLTESEAHIELNHSFLRVSFGVNPVCPARITRSLPQLSGG